MKRVLALNLSLRMLGIGIAEKLSELKSCLNIDLKLKGDILWDIGNGLIGPEYWTETEK